LFGFRFFVPTLCCGAEGLYWVNDRIKISGKDVKDLAFLKLSPNWPPPQKPRV
jgi:hypothetical protein